MQIVWQDQLEHLKIWLQSRVITLHPSLEIKIIENLQQDNYEVEEMTYTSVGYGIYLKAGHEIAKDEVVATIPLSAVLSTRTSSYNSSNLPLHLSQSLKLALCVYFEACLGEQSEWCSYLQSLPSEIPVAYLWKPEARVWIRGTAIERVLKEEGLSDKSSEIIRHALEEIESRLNTHDSFLTFDQSLALVTSRSFFVDNFHQLAMVPLADIFNHSPWPHVTLQTENWVCPICGSIDECDHDRDDDLSEVTTVSSTPSSSCEMISLTPMMSNSISKQVFNTYGDHLLSNALLLIRYGFSVQPNPHDRISWTTSRDVAKVLGKQWSVPQQANLKEILRNSPPLADNSEYTTPWQPGEVALDLYLDADARFSYPLFILLMLLTWPSISLTRILALHTSLSLNTCGPDTHALLLPLVENIVHLIGSYRELSYRPEADLHRELLPLLDNTIDPEVRLALSFAIDERLCLRACENKWQDLVTE